MIDPFRLYRRELRRNLDLRLNFRSCKKLQEIPRIVSNSKAELVFISTSWRQATNVTVDLFAHLRDLTLKNKKLVYLDSFDQTSSPFLAIIPHIDLYVKKQLLKDRMFYSKESSTGFIFADYMQDTFGVEMGAWRFGSTLESEKDLAKIVLGWNLGTAKYLSQEARRSHSRSMLEIRQRKIDVHCRSGTVPKSKIGRHYNAHRTLLRDTLDSAPRTWKTVNTLGVTIPRRHFLAEMRNSKLSISPFGWGEVSYRDFEIVISGAALVKPDMSHLETEPDIFVPGKTYVPFNWDASNLISVCERQLNNPNGLASLARNARETYSQWFSDGSFLRKMEAILNKIEF